MIPTIEFDERRVRKIQEKLEDIPEKAPQVISAALNRAVTNIAANISKEVRKDYNVKSSDIKGTLEKTRATRSNIDAIVRSRGELFPLDRFKVSPRKVEPKRKKPIKVAVKKDGLKPLERAFVASINGLKVFQRTNRNVKRLPIERMFGPSIPQMIDHEPTIDKIEMEGRNMVYRRLDHEINRILEQGSG